ncbi:MAG: adenylate/guanylate cyclase domain-containing protein, partial [Nitrospirae bacterium]|nr:adenylate/guanylate cyclase domain-containing protein [Nitrospirota bacterium]
MKFLLLATQRYKRFVPIAALLLSVSLFLTLFTALGSFDIIENRILNVKFQLRPRIKINPNIITLDIDDKDIDVTGRWPWPWFIHGDIMNFLTEYGVADIVFVNMDFSQGSINAIDRGSVESVKNRILNRYGEKDMGSTIPDYEAYLSDSLKKNGNACSDVDFKIPEPDATQSVTGTLKTFTTTIEKHSLELLSAKTAVEGTKWKFPVATNIIIPKDSILKSMACAGFNQIHLSPDGVVRKYPLMAIYQNMLYGSLPLNLVRKLLHTENIYTGDSGYIKLTGEQSSVKIPVDNTGSMNINWAGSYNDTFVRLPFSMISYMVAYQSAKDEVKKFTVIEDIEKYVPLKLSELPYISKETADKIFSRAFAAFYIEQNIVDHGMSEAEALTSMGLDPTDNFWLSMAKQIKFNNYIVKKHEENKIVPPLKDVITDLSLAEDDLKSMNLTESYNLMAYHIERNDVYRVRPLFFIMPDFGIDGKNTVISPLYLKDKIVFYGLTATALTALNPTPYLRHHPMLDLMPNALNTIMTGQFLTDCPVWLKYSLNFILVVIVLNVVMLFTPIRSGPVTLLVAAVYALIDWYFFTKQGLLLPTFQAVSAIALAFISGVLYKYIRESMERQKIRKMFSAMVSPEVLKMLEKHPEKFNRGGEKKLATMFSSDVSGFTTISEGVTSRELADILNIYLTPMSNIIMSYDGYVDKYEGDAIKADFGIPLDDNDQATKCCLSALYSQEELKVIQRMIAIEYGVMITARMGINTGVISAAIMGSYNHMQYTAMGDAATFAEELEPANK